MDGLVTERIKEYIEKNMNINTGSGKADPVNSIYSYYGETEGPVETIRYRFTQYSSILQKPLTWHFMYFS